MSANWDDAPAFMDFEEPMGYDEAVAHGAQKPGAKRAGKNRVEQAGSRSASDGKPVRFARTA